MGFFGANRQGLSAYKYAQSKGSKPQALSQEFIDLYAPATAAPDRVKFSDPRAYQDALLNFNKTNSVRTNLLNQFSQDQRNLPENNTLESLYQIYPLTLTGEGADAFFSQRTALKESLFNLEQKTKAEKLKSLKKDRQTFGGSASAPASRVVPPTLIGGQASNLGGSDGKTLLGG